MRHPRGIPAPVTVHQTGVLDRNELEILNVSTRSFEAGAAEPLHVHEDEGQFKWPGGHAMVSTPCGIFVLPRDWAVWIPAGQHHAGLYSEALKERNVHVHSSHCEALPQRCCAVRVTAKLARAVIRALDQRRLLPGREARDRALLDCLRDEIVDLGVAPVAMRLPSRARIRPVADLLLAQPGSNRTISQWAALVGMSASTINRDFIEDTGLTFGEWRKRARLLSALSQLAGGSEVASVAHELGYRSSSFIHMFRQTLGMTPGRYFR